MFYVPECGEEYIELKDIIVSHGGLVVEQHECFTYQIKPEQAKLKNRDFYEGNIYISNWIIDQVSANKGNP